MFANSVDPDETARICQYFSIFKKTKSPTVWMDWSEFYFMANRLVWIWEFEIPWTKMGRGQRRRNVWNGGHWTRNNWRLHLYRVPPNITKTYIKGFRQLQLTNYRLNFGKYCKFSCKQMLPNAPKHAYCFGPTKAILKSICVCCKPTDPLKLHRPKTFYCHFRWFFYFICWLMPRQSNWIVISSRSCINNVKHVCMFIESIKYQNIVAVVVVVLSVWSDKYVCFQHNKWAAGWEMGLYNMCDQCNPSLACAVAQSHLELCCTQLSW